MLSKAERGPVSYHCRIHIWETVRGRWKYAIVTASHRIGPVASLDSETHALRAAQNFVLRTNMEMDAIVKGKQA